MSRLVRYTRFYVIDDKCIALYNYNNDKAIYIDTFLFSIVSKYLLHDSESLLSIHPSLYNALEDNSFLINDQDDDLGICINRLRSVLSNNDTYILTINPTMDCNLRCWYCYQKHTHYRLMSPETIESTLKFAENITRKDSIKTLQLSLFGGEPLIAAQTVSIPLAQKISHYCRDADKQFKLHITTNATLLTDKIISEIEEACTDCTLQIPFDGNKAIHNKIKHSSKINDSYTLTLSNMISAIDRGFRVNIRCNYDNRNILSFIDLISDVKKLCRGNSKHRIRFDFQKIWQEKVTNELSSKYSAVRSYLFECFPELSSPETNLPTSFCYADYDNSIVINYDGLLYKCTARDFSSQNSIGHITPEGSLSINSAKYNFCNRFSNACIHCDMLPICTVCIENRLDQKGLNAECPISITPIDIEQQIRNRFEALFGHKILSSASPS